MSKPGSRERKTLQPWVNSAFKDRPGWVAWKVEDAYRAGLPDYVIKSPMGRVSWVELKWSLAKREISSGLTQEQWGHLRTWGAGAYLLIAVPSPDRAFLIPISALPSRVESFTVPALERLPGVESCACDRKEIGHMLRDILI